MRNERTEEEKNSHIYSKTLIYSYVYNSHLRVSTMISIHIARYTHESKMKKKLCFFLCHSDVLLLLSICTRFSRCVFFILHHTTRKKPKSAQRTKKFILFCRTTALFLSIKNLARFVREFERINLFFRVSYYNFVRCFRRFLSSVQCTLYRTQSQSYDGAHGRRADTSFFRNFSATVFVC